MLIQQEILHQIRQTQPQMQLQINHLKIQQIHGNTIPTTTVTSVSNTDNSVFSNILNIILIAVGIIIILLGIAILIRLN
mgnify:FL=1|jgi:hypothetical protein